MNEARALIEGEHAKKLAELEAAHKDSMAAATAEADGAKTGYERLAETHAEALRQRGAMEQELSSTTTAHTTEMERQNETIQALRRAVSEAGTSEGLIKDATKLQLDQGRK